MKTPDNFTGKDPSKFRSWWRAVENYMEVYEPTMPNDKVKIAWVSSLMREQALNWHHARDTKFKTNKIVDTWALYKEALEKRFVDQLELKKDDETMRAMVYEGSIDNYIARLEEYNSRVGLSGITFRNIVSAAMSPEIRRMVFSRAGRFPDEDDEFLMVIRDAGRTVEEEKRVEELYKKKVEVRKNLEDKSSKTVKGTKDAVSSGKGNQSGQKAEKAQEQGKRPVKEATGAKKGTEKKPSLWKSGKEAYEGVPQAEIDDHKAKGVDCRRCGRDSHNTYECYARKTIAGTDLPVHPSKKGSSAATKRKQTDDQETPEPKKGKVAAVVNHDTAMEQARIWEMDSDDEMSDF